MTSRTPRRDSVRLRVQLPPHLHELVEQAAAFKGQSVTAFVGAVVEDSARSTINEDRVFRAAREHQRRFARAFIAPTR